MKTKATSFRIRPFKNPSGEVVYQVDGFINGKRIRKNLVSRKEASAERDALELQAIQAVDSNLRLISTFLSDEELRQAEAVFRRIKGDSRTLTQLVDFALTHHTAPQTEKLICEGVTEYIAARQVDHQRKLISDTQFKTIRVNLTRFAKGLPKVKISELTADTLTAFCSKKAKSLKTHNNLRGILSTFLKHARLQGWISTDPIEKVPHYRIAHQRGTAKTLTAERTAALMRFVETYNGGRMVPFFALCLFAGIRPCLRTGEISRLSRDAIKDTGVIHVEPDVSKVNTKRSVEIQPNLAAWLKAYPLDKFPIIAPDMQRHRALIAKQFGLSHDIMRHTFISMHIAKFRSMGDTALQAGNSEDIIRKHYLDVKSKAEAEVFFNIMPKKAAEPEAEEATPSASLVTLPFEKQQLAA